MGQEALFSPLRLQEEKKEQKRLAFAKGGLARMHTHMYTHTHTCTHGPSVSDFFLKHWQEDSERKGCVHSLGDLWSHEQSVPQPQQKIVNKQGSS